MLDGITLGQYFPGDSVLHRLDPRAKIALTVLLVVLVFIAHGFVSYAILFAAVVGLALSSKISPKLLMKAVKPILFIVAFTFVLNIFFVPTGRVVFKLGFMQITDDGLVTATYLAIRLVLLVLTTQLLTLTTSPIELTDGLESLMKPLSKIGFPAHELAMMMSIALRFIPTLLEEADKIMKAQMARGADFESGNLMARAKAMIPLLVPLFVSAFRRADELALAMEARCYRGGANRSRLKVLKFHRLDAIATLCVVALGVVVMVLPW